MATISSAVEGITDEAVVLRLIAHVGAEAGPVYGKQGKTQLRERVRGYNHAARHAPWVVLVDLDREAACAPPLLPQWLAAPNTLLCLRFAVRAIEAWLLADPEAIAAFLSVARGKVPGNPEGLDNPKETMVGLARASRRRNIRDDMVPREGSGRAIGPAYASRLIEFASSHWRPNVAAGNADSLRRAIACLERLAA